MAASLDMAQTQRANSKRSKITVTQKRWMLSAHLLCIAAWLGASFCSLAFNITALFTTDSHLLNTVAVFTDALDHTIIRFGAGGTLLTGVLHQSYPAVRWHSLSHLALSGVIVVSIFKPWGQRKSSSHLR